MKECIMGRVRERESARVENGKSEREGEGGRSEGVENGKSVREGEGGRSEGMENGKSEGECEEGESEGVVRVRVRVWVREK